MNIETNLQRARIERVLGFDRDNAGAFPAKGVQRDNLARLAAIGERLGALVPQQETHERQSQTQTLSKREAFDALHDKLVDVSVIASALADDHPDLPRLFALPDGKREQAWVDAASALAANLKPHLALFESYGLSSDFLSDLSDDLAAYQSAATTRTSHEGSRSGDTHEIEELLRENKSLVKKLDAFAGRAFKADPLVLGRWLQASTLGEAPKTYRVRATP